VVLQASSQHTRFVPLFLFYFSFANLILIPLIPFLMAVAVLHQSRVDATNVANEVTTASGNNTKDDIARLIHLYKYPGAQMHWTNYYGVLSRAQLDARRSTGVQADAANALSCLAALYNDYEGFTPQNAMVAYVYDATTRSATKKIPYEPSEDEWADLATHCHDIEPTNYNRRSVLKDAAWIKSTWNDVRRYLHAVFVMYNRSGQHDPDMGEWCSPKEQDHWVCASLNKTSGSNTIVHFPTVMIYSISVLEEADFVSLGREMPKGTGIDNSVVDGTMSKASK
jgi:hypothetical protein